VDNGQLPRLVEHYRSMALIRAFETRVAQLYRDAAIPGFIHTSVGQEAVAVGVCSALAADDYVSTTHRGHGHCLAKGADPAAAMAELFGKRTGLCKGKGGSMHIADAARGVLGANAIVGASVPIAAGAALASAVTGDGRVAVAFFGDGAANQGAVQETLNLAAIWSLPIVFVCENNVYAEFSDSRLMSRRESVVALGAAHGVPGCRVDGNDVEAVEAAAAEAVEACRQGDGPRLIEAMTYRRQGHYEGDPQTYKSVQEETEWREADPLSLARRRIEERQLASAAELDDLEREAEEHIDEAEAYARASDYPSLDELYDGVYSG
jgi:acetoin:2,6-dichlorophenolindophenol oxidoreductase subunit alpha